MSTNCRSWPWAEGGAASFRFLLSSGRKLSGWEPRLGRASDGELGQPVLLGWAVACAAPSGLVFPKFKPLEGPLLGWGREDCWTGFDLLVVSPWLEGVLLVVPVLAAQPQQESIKGLCFGDWSVSRLQKRFLCTSASPPKVEECFMICFGGFAVGVARPLFTSSRCVHGSRNPG